MVNINHKQQINYKKENQKLFVYFYINHHW